MVTVRKNNPDNVNVTVWQLAVVMYFGIFILVMNFLVLNMFIMVSGNSSL